MTLAERRAAWRGLTITQFRNDWLPETGLCGIRIIDGCFRGRAHPVAPAGTSHCRVCGRVVIRGEGRWWE